MTDNLVQNGLLVTVELCRPEKLTLETMVLWPSQDVIAVIDTAAADTLIQEGIATSLGLMPVGTLQLKTAKTNVIETYQYNVLVRFPDGIKVKASVIEVPYMLHPDNSIKCKIGRDILQYGLLTYNGPTNAFSLTF